MTSFMGSFGSRTGQRRPHTFRVYATYRKDIYWWVTFRLEGSTNDLPRVMRLTYPEKILEMLIRYGETKTAAEVHRVERDLSAKNAGAIWLVLSPEQLARLQM